MLSGGCLCDAVNFEIAGEVNLAGNCHCSVCRRAHGAAFVSWALINPESFRWTRGEDLLASYDSSPATRRLFCSRCGSHLAAKHGENVSEVVLANLHGDPGIKPAEHIFVGSKASWYEINDNLNQHVGWPPGMGA